MADGCFGVHRDCRIRYSHLYRDLLATRMHFHGWRELESPYQIICEWKWDAQPIANAFTEWSAILFVSLGGVYADVIFPCFLLYFLLRTSRSTTISTNVVVAIMTMAPDIPEASRGLLIMPSVAIQSVMACRLFRELKLGLIVDPVTRTGDMTTTLEFSSSAGGSRPPFIELDDLEFNTRGGYPIHGDDVQDDSIHKKSIELAAV